MCQLFRRVVLSRASEYDFIQGQYMFYPHLGPVREFFNKKERKSVQPAKCSQDHLLTDQLLKTFFSLS